MHWYLKNKEGEVVVSATVDAEWDDLGKVVYTGDIQLLSFAKTPMRPEMVHSIFCKAAYNHGLEMGGDPEVIVD